MIIPTELTSRPQWVVWRWEERDGKPDKPPYNPKTGKLASSTNPTTWTTFEQAMGVCDSGDWDGVGYVFTVDDPFAGVDLDNCIDPTSGEIAPWAQAIIKFLSSYSEVSPSKMGVKIFLQGRLPDDGRRRHGKALEMYDRGRYFTVTGDHVQGTPTTIEDRTAELTALHAWIFSPNGASPQPEASCRREVLLTDREIIAKAMAATNGAKFERLWSGDTSGYPSESEADLALTDLLAFWAGGDADQMDRLFRQSGLYRPKWDERRGPQTYGQITIDKALHDTREFYGDGESSQRREDPEDPAQERPSIQTQNRELRDITDDALKALVGANDPPRIFKRGNTLVRIVRDEHDKPQTEILARGALRGELGRVADWIIASKKTQIHVAPPMNTVDDILTLPSWPDIPPLAGLISGPVLTPQKTIIREPGYHRGSGLLYVGERLDLPSIPSVEEALEVLNDLLCDFPFADQASKANTIALLLSPPTRYIVPGCLPLFAIDAPTPGTGKGLLTTAIAIVSYGEPAHVMTAGRDEEEWRKRITSCLLAGREMVMIDNVSLTVRSAALSSVLTRWPDWQDRLLGHSKDVSVPNNTIWVMTGNNLHFPGEMVRRVVWIRLVPNVERPWEREDFRHPKLLRWTRYHRARLAAATLRLVEAWVAAGRPAFKERAFGSYEEWTEVVGGILTVAGIEGFLGNTEELYQTADPERLEWVAFVETWSELYEDRQVGVVELFELANKNNLLEAVLHTEGKTDTEHAQRIRLGKALGRRADQVFGDWKICQAEMSHRLAQYRLQRVSL
jgi:hypothetical protein